MADAVGTWEMTDDPEQQNEVFIRAFNSGDGRIFDSLYHDNAISNLSGAPLTGRARTEFITEFLRGGPKLEAKLRETYRTGDTSLLVVHYRVGMTGEDGQPVQISGTCTDVMTRGADGRWKLAIDRPVPDQVPDSGQAA
ncbi:YybH family protein [Saccharothrix sp. Mg75]|uniref:YybH family protein n=1 Tax=Saccharothrix sp. Mg75 TaxID=3445357 RepID=UPI003EEDC14C